MKTVVLAGGLGTRLSEETHRVPKPMVEIGERPILWHILKTYAAAGHSEFVIALGYKSEVVKRFFIDYRQFESDITVSTGSGAVKVHRTSVDEWTVHLVESGLETNTGGRVKRLERFLDDKTFMLTYGDGVSNVDINSLIDFHNRHGKMATVTAIRPPSRFGGLVLDDDVVVDFTEKPQIGEGWINGGFMVLERSVLEYIGGDDVSFEAEILEKLASDGELMAFRHEGFWQSMDTLRDVRTLQALWDSGDAPWRVW